MKKTPISLFSFALTSESRGLPSNPGTAEVMKKHGWSLKGEKSHAKFWTHPDSPGDIQTSKRGGKRPMWYHHTGEPAKDPWTAEKNISFGAGPGQLDEHLTKYHAKKPASESRREDPDPEREFTVGFERGYEGHPKEAGRNRHYNNGHQWGSDAKRDHQDSGEYNSKHAGDHSYYAWKDYSNN